MCDIDTYQHTMCFFWSDHNNEEKVHLPVLSADDAWDCLGQRFKISHGLIHSTKGGGHCNICQQGSCQFAAYHM